MPSPLFGNVDLLMDLLYVSEADSTVKAYYARIHALEKAVANGINMLDILPGNRFHVAFIYLL